ncbi:MAG: hypothetical protein ACXWLH_00210 [Candidatus Saccharimonadales bacterium]
MKFLKLGLGFIREYAPWIFLAVVALMTLLLYRLGSLTGGLSAGEIKAATDPVGWHGLWHHPQYLPIEAVRSLVFFIFPDHGQTLTRMPNVLFGALAVISFSALVWLWHGMRTAILSTLLFATAAWTLHVSRLASFDVLYFWAAPTLLISQALLHRYSDSAWVWYGHLLVLGLLLYIPGMIWLVVLQLVLQAGILAEEWEEADSRRRTMTILISIIWLPFLLVDLLRSGHFIQWLGLPAHWVAPMTILKDFGGVFVHLFVRGPQYPDIWLGRAPVLDIFTLVMSILGIYFYAKHWKAWRSRTIGLMFAIGVLLVGIHGPVTISFLVPFMYVTAAAGIAYVVHEWLKVFPLNPLARGLGISLIAVLVATSCIYNLRAYFVAWPHNQVTKDTFSYHR